MSNVVNLEQIRIASKALLDLFIKKNMLFPEMLNKIMTDYEIDSKYQPLLIKLFDRYSLTTKINKKLS